MITTQQAISSVLQDAESLRRSAPLVLSLTNSVVQPLTANLLLAAGAVPAMLNDGMEAEEMIRAGANALLVNLGTLTREQIETMRSAIRTANEKKIPWVLDPVAVGALSLRSTFAEEVKENHPRLIRGNASEIKSLSGLTTEMKGPESTDSSHSAIDAAVSLARSSGAAVLVTGETDYATDGEQIIAIHNGHPMMTKVTGVGCSMGALAAALAAVSSSPLQAAISVAVLMGVSGELAFEKAPRPGSFAVALLDCIYELTTEQIQEKANICCFNN